MTECKHSFLKASIRKLICNYDADWDELAHVAMMAYNVLPYSATGKTPLSLMFVHNAFMPTLFILLFQELRYMGEKGYRMYLDAMRDIYMMAVLNFKITRERCPPPAGTKISLNL